MQVVYGLRNLDHSTDPVFVVVGVFDGLHLGHAYLLRHLVAEAVSRHARPVVITFDHHPDEIITGSAPPLLCDPGERLDRLAASGVDTTVVVHFDQALRETTYDAFVAMIATRAPLAGFLMTPDAAFGYQRAGTPEALAGLGETAGFEVVVVPPLVLDGRQVRSTEVRAAITAGDLDVAAQLLGRSHTVVAEASAVPGGRELVFPLPVTLPPDGEYRVHVGARVAAGAQEVPAEERIAIIERGVVKLPGHGAAGAVRVEFLAELRRDPAVHLVVDPAHGNM
jgi:riboflavin kinase / FMN adenylyltransferase